MNDAVGENLNDALVFSDEEASKDSRDDVSSNHSNDVIITVADYINDVSDDNDDNDEN